MTIKKKLVIAAVGLVITGIVVWRLSSEKPVIVKVVPVKRGNVEQIVSSTSAGSVEPAEIVNLMSQYPGTITHIYYKKGERVKKGGIIISMDNALAKVDLDRTKEAYTRAKQLFNSHAVSKAVLDTAMYAYRAATVRYNKSFMTSPVSGVITQLNAHIGEFPFGGGGAVSLINPSSLQQSGPLVRIIDDKYYYIKAPFDEVDSGLIEVGQRAHITFDAFPNHVFNGKVIEVAPSISTALNLNRTIEARISIPKIRYIKMGMSADVEIIVNVAKNALYIPTYTIQESGSGNKYVWIINNNRVKKRNIQIGISNWDNSVITKGLKQGTDVVLLSDKYTLRDNMKVSTHD